MLFNSSSQKVHFIFRHQNPVTKEFEEKHLIEPPEAETDDRTHTYSICIHVVYGHSSP